MSTEPSDEAAEWHRIAEERRRQLERMQDQTLYRAAASTLGRARRIGGLVRRQVDPLRDTGVRIARSAVALPSRLRASGREDTLRRAVAALPAPSVDADRRAQVTAVIVTAHQPSRLDVLLAALGRIGIAAVVVDNAGVAANRAVVARHPHARHVRLDAPRNYAAANELAIAEVVTDWVLLLNDDVLPVDDAWLDRMLAAADAGTVAVGAQLVHGPRGLLGGAHVDGTVQHAGIGFVLDGPLARPVHLGRGSAPLVVDEVRDVAAATAACLLVRTDAHRAVGGLHDGFDYGSEDVDLCLRLAAVGAVRVAMSAVLLHEEGATRLAVRGANDRRERTARQTANRRLLDARHAPDLRRHVVDAALDGSGDRSARVVVAVAGSVPQLLRRGRLGGVGTVLVRRPGSTGALTIVTDPTRTPASEAAAPDAPVVGWLEDGVSPADGWSAERLGRLDALIAVGDAAVPDGVAAAHVHRVDDPDEVRAALHAVLAAPRWSVRIGAPSGRRAEQWGDTAIARALADELRDLGRIVRVVGRDGWGGPADRSADVTVHLKGRGVAPVAQAQTNVVWVMSHPSEVAPGELDAADLVLAGSEPLAERYRTTTGTLVEVLPQATDARRFVAGPVDPDVASRVLFIGNTRSVTRPVVLGAVDAGLPLTLVGSGWERYLDPTLVARERVPADELPRWYRSADVVLNDHWDDMARWGLVSNRVFDGLACGTCVVSDDVPGMRELLDDAVVTFRGRDEVGTVVRGLLDDPDERARRAERGRRAVLAAHTWAHRAATLVRLVDEQREQR